MLEKFSKADFNKQLTAGIDTESLRYPSWCLCRLLDTIIGTKEKVHLRRKSNIMRFHGFNVKASREVFHSGSNGEGFDFQSSDLDIMFINKHTIALEYIHDTLSDVDSKTVLLMRKEGCNPGFVILQLLNRTNDRAIIESVVDYCDQSVVSSLLYRDVHGCVDIGLVGHGPCNTFLDIDIASCFECNEWPTDAVEYIYRQRSFGWPQKQLLDKIICRGCHLVPIGDKNHDLSHIQWRLSFSAAEKDLVHSFNHTQFLVYGLLKIFLKQFIDKCQLSEGILCSYFLKTVIFYGIEGTPSSFWSDDLLIPCFWFCMNKLITWVEQGYCPNYFVQRNNMFRHKVFGQHRCNLLNVLYQCKHIGWRCIYLCEDLHILRNVISHPESPLSCELIPSERELEHSMDLIAVSSLSEGIYASEEEMQKAISISLNLFCYSRTQQEKDYSTLQLDRAFRNSGLSGFCIKDSTNNTNKYKTLRKLQRLFLTSSEDFAGLISIATFYYKTGQYLKAIHALERVMSMWKPYVLYSSFPHMSLYHSDIYQHYVCGRDIGLKNKIRSATAFDISIDRIQKIFYPVELSYDIEATAPFPLFVPTLPYTMFLLFLCHHKLGNIDGSLSVFHDLEALVWDEIQGGRQYLVVLNILAVCLDKLGIKHGAVEMCLLSQKLKPDRNGAERLLEKIVSGLC